MHARNDTAHTIRVNLSMGRITDIPAGRFSALLL